MKKVDGDANVADSGKKHVDGKGKMRLLGDMANREYDGTK